MSDLLTVVTEFREGILDGRSSEFMCIAVCSALEGYLRFAHSVDTHAVSGTVWDGEGYEREHFWLETNDGTVIDPTADQFPGLNLPPVYIGKLPTQYITDTEMD